MKLFLLLIIACCFLQTTIFPLNLVLILLIARGFVTTDLGNYWLAFLAGLILGLLSSQNLGIWPLVFILVIYLIHLFKKLPFDQGIKTFLPLSFMLLLLAAFLKMLIFGQTFHISQVLIEATLSVVVYLLIRNWEDRFIIKPGLRLKL